MASRHLETAESKSKCFVDATGWDLQKTDPGIALYHFAYGLDENVRLTIADPGLSAPDDVEYAATLIVKETH